MSQDPELIDMLATFKRICDMSKTKADYQTGLFMTLSKTGKKLTELTIGELLEIESDYKKAYAETHGGNQDYH